MRRTLHEGHAGHRVGVLFPARLITPRFGGPAFFLARTLRLARVIRAPLIRASLIRAALVRAPLVRTAVIRTRAALARLIGRRDRTFRKGTLQLRHLLAGQPFDIAQERALVTVTERDRHAVGTGARGAADPVDIAFRDIRQVEIDDVGNAVNIDAARGDIGGDQHLAGAIAEGGKRPLALGLRLVAMDRRGDDAGPLKIAHDLVGAVLGAGEDQRTAEAHLLIGQQIGQQRALQPGRYEDDLLRHPLRRGGDGGDGNLHRIDQQFAGQTFDLARHGGREEQVLTLRRQGLHDASDRQDEAHIEHLVGLVEHEDLDLVETHAAALQVIDQAARRGDDDIDAALQRLDLRAGGHAAEHRGDGEVEELAIDPEALGDLAGQFARRAENQHAAGAARRLDVVTLGGQPMQDRQGEGGGLAGTRLGDAQQVTALHDRRNRLGLNRGGGIVAFRSHSLKQRRGKAEIGKFSQNGKLSLTGPQTAAGRLMPALRHTITGISGTPRVAWAIKDPVWRATVPVALRRQRSRGRRA